MAAPAQAAVERTSQVGPSASAFFSNSPADPQPGDTYQEVTVNGGDIANTDPDFSGPSASIDIKRFTINSEGFPEQTSETITGASGSDAVSFSADRFLTEASLAATLDASKTCYPSLDAALSCEQTAGGTLSMTWTGTGALVRSIDNSRTVVPGVGVFLTKSMETTRDGSASGTALDLTLSDSQSASISRQDYRETLNLH